MPKMSRLAYNSPRFVAGETRLEPGDYFFTARIDDTKKTHYGKICIFGKTENKAEKLRDKIMRALNYEKS